MKNNMKYFMSYKDRPSLEVSADEASEFVDLFRKKYRDDINEIFVKGERKMVSHSFYDESFGRKCSVIGIIWEEKQNEKRK